MSDYDYDNPKKGHFRKMSEEQVEYWKTTYVQLNPFLGCPLPCPECGEDPAYQRRWWINPATSITEFKCPNKHTWKVRKTHD